MELVTIADILWTLKDISDELFTEENTAVEEVEQRLIELETADTKNEKLIAEVKRELKEKLKHSFIIDPFTWKGETKSRYDAWNKNNFINETRSNFQVVLDLSKTNLKRVGTELVKRIKADGLDFTDYRIRGDYILISKYDVIPDEED